MDAIESSSCLAIPDLHPIQHLTDVALESTGTLCRCRRNADHGRKIFGHFWNVLFDLPEKTLQENRLDLSVVVNLLIGCNFAVPRFGGTMLHRLVISGVLIHLLGFAE